MAKDMPTKTFDDAINRYERRLDGLRTVRQLLQDDPQFAHELVDLARSVNGSGRPATAPGGQGNTCEKIEVYFQQCENRWSTVREISEATGIRTGTASYTLYDKTDKFRKRKHPSDARKRQWKSKGGDGA